MKAPFLNGGSHAPTSTRASCDACGNDYSMIATAHGAFCGSCGRCTECNEADSADRTVNQPDSLHCAIPELHQREHGASFRTHESNHDQDVHNLGSNSPSLAFIVLSVTILVVTLLFAFVEPGACELSVNDDSLYAIGFEFNISINGDFRSHWEGHRCSVGTIHDRHVEELGMHLTNGCPPGFSCEGVGRSVAHSLYFVAVTFSTVGYGDVTPQTASGKMLATAFIFFCIVYLTAAASMIGSWLHGRIEERVDRRLENRQKEVHGTMPPQAASEEKVPPINMQARISKNTKADSTEMLQAMAIRMGALLATWVGGSVVFKFVEPEWDFVDSFYFCAVTMSSVGYGDLVLSNSASRAFGMVFALVSIFGTAAAAGSCVDIYLQYQTAQRIKGFSHEAVHSAFEAIDTDGSGSIDRAEFLSFILVQSGDVSSAKVQMINEVFDSLDGDRSGEVDINDIEAAIGSVTK
eukprot:SAG31_NODE_5356_length_2591_cov_1.283307_2_plen_465_part_00